MLRGAEPAGLGRLTTMLDENIHARINAYIAAETAPRGRALKEALQAEQNRLNARGLLRSGNAVRAAAGLGANELRVRATIVRDAVLRSHISMSGQLAESTLEDLREEIRGHVGRQARNVQSIVAASVTISIRDDHGKWRAEAEFPVRLARFRIQTPQYLGVGVTDEVRVRIQFDILRSASQLAGARR